MIDINRGFNWSWLVEQGYLLKFPCWGMYPLQERDEIDTFIQVLMIQKRMKTSSSRNAKADIAAALNIPEAQKEQARNLSKGMADFFKGPKT